MTLPRFSARPDDPDFFQNPYPAYVEMRGLGSAFVWKEYDMVCFARHEQVNAILRDRRFGREVAHVMSHAEAGLDPVPLHLAPFQAFSENSMLEREPPVHTRLRGLVNRAFVSRRIERMRSRVSALAHELIDGFEASGQIDLLPVFAKKIPVTIIAELLGVPVSMSDQLLDWSGKMVAMYQFNRTRRTEDEAVAATEEFSAFIRDYANRRRDSPGDDLITALIEAEEHGDRLDNDELVANCIQLLNAGHEATVHAIGNAVKALVQNGVDTAAVFGDEKAGLAAADELIRFDPPLHLFTRYALEDVELAGVGIGRGQQVALLLGAANHDPDMFAVPGRLDFARGAAGHLGFGAGIHFCIGAPLARLEMAAAIPVLFERLPDLRLAETPAYADRYHFHGLERLEVEWSPR